MSEERTITPAQCRAARAMLGWSRDDLATRSRVGRQTLADFETDKRSPYERTLADVRRTLEEGGILFMPAGSDAGAGVRLMEPNAR